MRRIISILAVASLLLWFAIVALWGRSHWKTDSISFAYSGRPFNIILTSRRGLWVQWVTGLAMENRPIHLQVFSADEKVPVSVQTSISPDRMTIKDFAGVRIQRGTGSTNLASDDPSTGRISTMTIINATWPALLLLPLFLPALRILIVVRDRRFSRNCYRRAICPICRYDLRASAGRCPECGTAIPDQLLPAKMAD